ncbi:MAG: 2-dehydropantoate 2-reductase [Thermoplasmata archaeon]
MRIGIIGAGALGSFIGAKLSKEHEVILVCRRAHADAIREKGLKISGKTELLVKPSVACSAKELEEFGEIDLAIITVKAYDTYSAAKEYKKSMKRAEILSIQNGLGNLEAIERALGRKAIGGITSHGLTFLEAGHIIHTGLGRTVVGDIDIAKILTKSGIETNFTENIEGEIWAKGVVNACINPLTAILRVKNGVLLELPEVKKVMKSIFCECYEVARRKVRLPVNRRELKSRVFDTVRLTSENKSSMLQDVENGRKTEIGQITGEFVIIGKEFGLEMPVNETILALMRGVEKFSNRQE